MQIQVDKSVLEIRNDGKQTFEVLLGETATLAPAASSISQTTGATATISGGTTITPSAAGLSKYTVTLPDNSVFELRLFTCETACTTTIAGQARPVGYGISSPPRLVLRALVNDRPSWFTGTNASLVGHSLTDYGA